MDQRKVESLENKAIKCIINREYQEAIDVLGEIKKEATG